MASTANTTQHTRPVRVYHFVRTPNENGQGYHYPKVVQHEVARFHQFSIASEELDTGAAHCPVGIVELTDGTVITPAAHMLQFLDADAAGA